MRTWGVGLLAVAWLSGCATAGPRADQVTFDRGAFALAYGDFVTPLLLKCAKKAETPDCVRLHTLDAQVRQAILDAPKQAAEAGASPLDTLLPLIMKLAPLAMAL